MDRLHPITKALQAGVQKGTFPGAVLFVRLRNTILYHEAVGLTASLPSSPATHLATLLRSCLADQTASHGDGNLVSRAGRFDSPGSNLFPLFCTPWPNALLVKPAYEIYCATAQDYQRGVRSTSIGSFKMASGLHRIRSTRGEIVYSTKFVTSLLSISRGQKLSTVI